MAEKISKDAEQNIQQQLKELSAKIDILHDTIEKQKHVAIMPAIPGLGRLQKVYRAGKNQVKTRAHKLSEGIKAFGKGTFIGSKKATEH